MKLWVVYNRSGIMGFTKSELDAEQTGYDYKPMIANELIAKSFYGKAYVVETQKNKVISISYATFEAAALSGIGIISKKGLIYTCLVFGRSKMEAVQQAFLLTKNKPVSRLKEKMLSDSFRHLYVISKGAPDNIPLALLSKYDDTAELLLKFEDHSRYFVSAVRWIRGFRSRETRYTFTPLGTKYLTPNGEAEWNGSDGLFYLPNGNKIVSVLSTSKLRAKNKARKIITKFQEICS